MIFMLHMQYNAPNCMYVFQKKNRECHPGPPFGAGIQNQAEVKNNNLRIVSTIVLEIAQFVENLVLYKMTFYRTSS